MQSYLSRTSTSCGLVGVKVLYITVGLEYAKELA
jgi:hypothetical protein